MRLYSVVYTVLMAGDVVLVVGVSVFSVMISELLIMSEIN